MKNYEIEINIMEIGEVHRQTQPEAYRLNALRLSEARL